MSDHAGGAGGARDGVDADAFARLLGRQPSDAERERLHRLREVLGLDGNDALWLVLVALQYHLTLFDAIPARIERTAASACAKASAAAARAAREPTHDIGFGWPALIAAAMGGAIAALIAVVLLGLAARA
ncbi:MAG: hypothetical protein C0423_01875 [Methylibium sp.]|nr:hypothetical protein [Methylibium sp.]